MTSPGRPAVRLTVAQAEVPFLAHQYGERDHWQQRLFAGCLGILGHGNVAGVGQALLQEEVLATRTGQVPRLPHVLARNEQAMVHTAVAHARQQDRLQAWACTASVGPGSTNMTRTCCGGSGTGRRTAAQVAELDSTNQAYEQYPAHKATQRPLVDPTDASATHQSKGLSS